MKLQELLGSAYHDGMTLEEVENALGDVALPKSNDQEISKLKNAISKSNSEVAKYKDLLRSKQTEEEAKAQEIKEAQENLAKENAELKKRISISENASALLGLGYDSELAMRTATAMFDGDMTSVIANHKAFIEARDKAIRNELLSNTPYPTGSSVANPLTKEQILAIKDVEARQRAIAENIDLFN